MFCRSINASRVIQGHNCASVLSRHTIVLPVQVELHSSDCDFSLGRKPGGVRLPKSLRAASRPRTIYHVAGRSAAMWFASALDPGRAPGAKDGAAAPRLDLRFAERRSPIEVSLLHRRQFECGAPPARLTDTWCYTAPLSRTAVQVN